MSRRRTILHLIAKAAMLFAALFVVTVLLAAIPAHHPPVVPQGAAQQGPRQTADSARNTKNPGSQKSPHVSAHSARPQRPLR